MKRDPAPPAAKPPAVSAPRAGEEQTEVATYLRERAAVEPAAKAKEQEAVARQLAAARASVT